MDKPDTTFVRSRPTTAREHVARMLVEYGDWKVWEKALEAGERIARKCQKACER